MGVHVDALVQRYGDRHKPWQDWTDRYPTNDVAELISTPRRRAILLPAINRGFLESVPFWNHQDGIVRRPPYRSSAKPFSPTLTSQQCPCNVREPTASSPRGDSPWLGANNPKQSMVAFPFGDAALALPLFQNGTHSWQGDYREGPRQGVKRRRALSDVDGPNTAGLGCKKRRLRRNLITSRLSRPFSMPASHIINRESVALGDRRFPKLTALLSTRRMQSSMVTPAHQVNKANQANYLSTSTFLRKAAIINRFRLRSLNVALERGSNPASTSLPTSAALLAGSRGFELVVEAEFPVRPLPSQGSPLSGQSVVFQLLSQDAVQQQPSSATVDTSASPNVARSPRSKPVKSPVLYSSRHRDEEEYFDEEETAFPTMEFESRYELSEENDHVYADLGLIFGGSSTDGLSDDEPDQYDDCMDDIDGIPLTAR